MSQIKKLRQSKGLTQFQLAQISGVSLPTIQNIESDKANPSVLVLKKILASLGAQLEISLIQNHKDILDFFNMSLIEFKSVKLTEMITNLDKNLNSSTSERELDLFASLCTALLDHYPQWLKKNGLHSVLSKQFHSFPKNLDRNRRIKFRRIWLAKLSQVI